MAYLIFLLPTLPFAINIETALQIAMQYGRPSIATAGLRN